MEKFTTALIGLLIAVAGFLYVFRPESVRSIELLRHGGWDGTPALSTHGSLDVSRSDDLHSLEAITADDLKALESCGMISTGLSYWELRVVTNKRTISSVSHRLNLPTTTSGKNPGLESFERVADLVANQSNTEQAGDGDA